MLNNLNEIRERYLQDSLPKRLGALAADLARVVSFAKNPNNKDAVETLFEESRWFIEWTALDTQPEHIEALIQLQLTLAIWHLKWDSSYTDLEKVTKIRAQASLWSDRVLAMSGIMDGRSNKN
ncbi:MAG: hypothetical protein HZB77_11305 [Chloroflexi bacterium]|nr:hypothetical protein [Chloroflexota bacterium]